MKRKRRVSKGNPIVSHRLENISKALFKNHAKTITELIGRSPGVYALYDDMGLYYVGKSEDLKGRVFHHLKDRHAAMWTHFSLYLLKQEKYVDEIESLLIRIASPKGNRVRPKGRADGAMLRQLKRAVKAQALQEVEEMFGRKRKVKRVRKGQASSLDGLVSRNTRIFREYKGKEYRATLTPKGQIRFKDGKIFDSPSAAGKSIVKHGCNGWRFWYLKDENNDVITLDDLRNKK